MLVLSIISVLLVVISKNVRRDSIDQIQAEQYEDYYNVVEQELLKILSGDSLCTLEMLRNDEICDLIDLGDLSNYGVLNSADLLVTSKKQIEFTNLVVPKDKNITLKLGPDNYTGAMTFSWAGEVAWVVNIDYQMNDGEYKTIESVVSPSTIFQNGPVNCTGGITNITTNSFTLNVGTCVNTVETVGSYNTLAVRMRPIMLTGNTTSLSLSGTGAGLPAQLIFIQATANIDDDLGNTPTIQLELKLPLTDPYLEILDYALRTQNKVIKNQNP